MDSNSNSKTPGLYTETAGAETLQPVRGRDGLHYTPHHLATSQRRCGPVYLLARSEFHTVFPRCQRTSLCWFPK